ncbi:hypothetical protein F5B21DRAFT_521829 [Xylaria acuta]|nr:hypothetical protein F5B21DRAFT_521829 [Xylaria acuta]
MPRSRTSCSRRDAYPETDGSEYEDSLSAQESDDEYAEGSSLDPSEEVELQDVDDLRCADTDVGEQAGGGSFIPNLDIAGGNVLFQGNLNPLVFYRQGIAMLDEKVYDRKEYSAGTTKLIDRAEKQWRM